MHFGILGPLRVRDGADRDADIRGRRGRGLLLRLLVDADAVVSVGRLREDLWEGSPPRGAAQTIQSHVSNLRRALGRDRIENQSGVGYRLVLRDGDEIDALAFADEVERGRALLGSQPETAAHILERALDALAGRAPVRRRRRGMGHRPPRAARAAPSPRR